MNRKLKKLIAIILVLAICLGWPGQMGLFTETAKADDSANALQVTCGEQKSESYYNGNATLSADFNPIFQTTTEKEVKTFVITNTGTTTKTITSPLYHSSNSPYTGTMSFVLDTSGMKTTLAPGESTSFSAYLNRDLPMTTITDTESSYQDVVKVVDNDGKYTQILLSEVVMVNKFNISFEGGTATYKGPSDVVQDGQIYLPKVNTDIGFLTMVYPDTGYLVTGYTLTGYDSDNIMDTYEETYSKPLTRADIYSIKYLSNGTSQYLCYGDINITVHMKKGTYTLSASASPHGSISDSGDTSITAFEDKPYTVTPDDGYRVKRVYVDGVGVDMGDYDTGSFTYTLKNVTANHTVTADFESLSCDVDFSTTPKSATVSLTDSDGNQVTPQDGEYSLTYGKKYTYAISADGYQTLTDSFRVQGDDTIKASLNKKGSQTIAASDTYQKTYGDGAFSLGASASGGGALSYYTTDSSVASVDATGKVAIHSVGTATVVIGAAATDACTGAEKEVTVRVEKAKQKVTAGASQYSKTVGDAAFSLGAKTDGGGSLTYDSYNKSVAVVSSSGKVSIRAAGTAKITVTAAATANYAETVRTITVTVSYPPKAVLASVKSTKAGQLTVGWKKAAKADGYRIRYSTRASFSGGVSYVDVNGASAGTKTVKGLKAGKRYYVQVRACTSAGGKKYYGAWSNSRNVAIKG